MIKNIGLWLADNLTQLKFLPILLGLGIALGWYGHTIWQKAKQTEALTDKLASYIQSDEKSYRTELDILFGNNKYEEITRAIDKEAKDAPDFGGNFDASSVRRQSDRIAAGKTARASHAKVP